MLFLNLSILFLVLYVPKKYFECTLMLFDSPSNFYKEVGTSILYFESITISITITYKDLFLGTSDHINSFINHSILQTSLQSSKLGAKGCIVIFLADIFYIFEVSGILFSGGLN